MNVAQVTGKFLDQPRLIGYFSRTVPAVLAAGGVAYTYQSVKKAPEAEKKKTLIKNIAVLSSTIAFALVAPKASLKIVKAFKKKTTHHHEHHLHVEHHNCKHVECHHEHGHEHEHNHEHEHGVAVNLKKLKLHVTDLVDDFLEENKVSPDVNKILQKAKTKVLMPKEIKKIYEELCETKSGKEFLSGEHGLIPDPEHIDSNHIFKGDLPRISIMGLFPVIGGILGGIAGDKLTEKNWREKVPDKIKEGSYQYLANIFLCNVGAGAALYAMEKSKNKHLKTKAARAIGMIGGIILAGVVFGSAIANLVGKKIIDPLVDKNKPQNDKNLFNERKPELLDISLHVDDIATVAVLSGLKWIEPALPVLYSISGYRAGIGYRNGENHHHH